MAKEPKQRCYAIKTAAFTAPAQCSLEGSWHPRNDILPQDLLFPVMHQRLSRSEEDVLLAWRRTAPPFWAGRSRDSQPSSPRPPLCPSQRAKGEKKKTGLSSLKRQPSNCSTCGETKRPWNPTRGLSAMRRWRTCAPPSFFFLSRRLLFPSPSFISRIQPALARYHVTRPARPPDRAVGV